LPFSFGDFSYTRLLSEIWRSDPGARGTRWWDKGEFAP
jgi:hypothetical protein